MNKIIAIVAAFCLTSLVAANARADNNTPTEWRGSVKDFEIKPLQLPAGTHNILVLADQPISCGLIGSVDSDPVKFNSGFSEGNGCFIKFQVDKPGTLNFFISYYLKGKPTAFTYHAAMLN